MRSAYRYNRRNTYLAARSRADRRASYAAKAGRERKASGNDTATARPASQAAPLDQTATATAEQAQTPETTTALTGTPDLFQPIEAAIPDDSPPDAAAGTKLLTDAEAACRATISGLRSPGFRDLAAPAQSPGGLAELAGLKIDASIDAVGEAIRRHGREGAIARYLLAMEKSLLPVTDRRRVERPGGYFRKLTTIPNNKIAASFRALENARAA